LSPTLFFKQFRAETVHHAHHDHQGGDAEHHRPDAEAGDQADEAFTLARQQIAPRDHSFVPRENHAVLCPAPGVCDASL
jgi:hypothetical protein